MRRQYSRTPHELSIVERMTQEQAGITPGTRCAIHMVKGTPVIKGGKRVGTKRDGGTPIGQCPRFAVHLLDGLPVCDAHKGQVSR